MSDEQTTQEEGKAAANMVPSYRLKEEADKRREAEAQQTAMAEQLKALQSELAKATEAMESIKSGHSQDMTLMSLGVTDPEIREFVRSRYGKTEDAGSFDEWIEGQKAKPSPLLAPFLTTAPKAEPAKEAELTVQEDSKPADPVKAAPPGNPNAGANQPASTNGKVWGTDDIKAVMAQNGGRLGANKDAILKALAAEGLIRPKA